MKERVERLFGFNPICGDHYGKMFLYNHFVHNEMSDEELLAIRAGFLQWKADIQAIFAEQGYPPEELKKRWNDLFLVDPMFGTLMFLEIVVDTDKGAEPYREAIVQYCKDQKPAPAEERID